MSCSPGSPHPVFNSYRGVRLANSRHTQSCTTQAMLWSSTTRLCFSIEALIICHLGVPHRQFTPCDWCPSIYNLRARTSQRRALSKRINSPPPNRYIFNRDQSAQNKTQCQTHNPFTSPFWVWTKPEALSSHIHPSPSTSGRPPTISILLGVQPNQDRQ